jgi:ABC-type phosphate transport system substrate-binding protein
VAAGEPALAVIVHPTRAASLSVDDVAHIFLRQRRFWGDGARIVPINQGPATAARQLFTRRVLRMDTDWLQRYWNERYFSGVLPPVVMSSPAAVKRYVASNPDAIGYLWPSEADESVHVVLKLE